MAENKEQIDSATGDSGIQNPEHDIQSDFTTTLPHPGAGDIFNESRANFGEEFENQSDEKDVRLEEFGTPKSDRVKINTVTVNNELLINLIESIQEMKSQIQSMANEVAKNNQATIDLRAEFSEKLTVMQAKIASDVHKIYEPIKRHITGLTRIVQDNENKSAVMEVNIAQIQLDVNAIKKKVENLENTDKLRSPNTESTRIHPRLTDIPEENEDEESDDDEEQQQQRQTFRNEMTSTNKIKIKPPTFDGSSNKRPIKFIKEFRHYCEVTNPTFTEMKYLLSQSLEKAAKEWWELVEDQVNSFEDVEKRFTNRFWSHDVQRRVRKDLEFGKYPEKPGKLTKVEYATRTFGAARDLIPPPSDPDIVASLSQHFTEEIRATIISRGFETLEQLIELLEKLDQSGPVNTGNEEGKPQNQKPNSNDKNEQRPFKMPPPNNWNNNGYQNNNNRGNQNWQNNRQNWNQNNGGFQNNRGYQNTNGYNQQNRNFNYQQNYGNQRPNNGNFNRNQQNGGQNGNNRPNYSREQNQNQNRGSPQNNGGYRPTPNNNDAQQPPIQTIEAQIEPQPSTSKAGNA
ncbi:myb-like protein P [Venturia canescens]|uniref:myb-like protein P n=1 Tax=Venturia canescens TaxID=32260 RepID=UPI001C9BCA62|nr:myb-like protein P [Venturia canescens]